MNNLQAARIAFAGTPDFAVPCLTRLIESHASIDVVFTQPDRPAGRGRKLQASPVKRAALDHGIDLLQPVRLDTSVASQLPPTRPDLLIVVAYGLILPQWMLDWPRVAPVNVHASLLPRWRGAAPIQHAILAGDTESGISIMRMTRGLDCGPVYAKRPTPIGATETAGELHDRLAEVGAALLIETLPSILAGTLDPVPQTEASACYAPKIDKRDSALDFHLPAHVLERQVRGFNPWPVAEARNDAGIRLRIWQAEVVDQPAAGPPGTVMATGPSGIDVATGRGVLRLIMVQPPGGRKMSAAAYLAAHALDGVTFVGTR